MPVAVGKIWRSLSGRLLMLTIIFVMIAEILIFAPSVARHRLDYLNERVERGQIAGLAALAAGDAELSSALQSELVRKAEVFRVSILVDGANTLMLRAPMPTRAAEKYDLRNPGFFELLYDALELLVRPTDRYIHVVGASSLDSSAIPGASEVHVIVDEAALRDSMLAFAVRIFWLSILISAFTATLVFLSVNHFLLRPIQRVIDGIVSFREDPEDAARVLQTSGVSGEIGLAERELAETQREVRMALKQKSRLAALGEAVAKINHDLRNILASAQLLADRLEASRDPTVQKVGPKLIGSLDRAIRLCRQTLEYGRADEPPPLPQRIVVRQLAEDLRAALGVEGREPTDAPMTLSTPREEPAIAAEAPAARAPNANGAEIAAPPRALAATTDDAAQGLSGRALVAARRVWSPAVEFVSGGVGAVWSRIGSGDGGGGLASGGANGAAHLTPAPRSNGVASPPSPATPADPAASPTPPPEPAAAARNGVAREPAPACVVFENRCAADFAFEADPDQIFRILLNLCRNAAQAIEATGEDGVVALEARRNGATVEIDVVDTGPGLPEKAQAHLFTAFKGSARKGGSGLGVVIASELARGHGGALALVESTAAGARFRLTLPQPIRH